MKREVVAAAMVATLALVGCSGANTQAQSDQATVVTEENGGAEVEEDKVEEDATQAATEREKANVGDTIPVKTDRGDLNVTVDGFVRSASQTEQWKRYNDVPDGTSLCELTMLVENVSYDNGQGSDTVFLDGYVYVNDPDGITINAEGSAWDYGQYEAAPGYAFGCNVGQKKRVAVPFMVSDSISEVTVVTDDYEVVVPVTAGE